MLLLAAMLLVAFVTACAAEAPPPAPAETPAPVQEATPEPDAPVAAPEETPEPEAPVEGVDMKVALVAHGPESIQFDGSFNEGAWNGILNFLSAQGLDAGTHAMFFQSHAADDDARVDVMADAITWGADILILPGFHFATSVYEAANLFPDTMFVILDAMVNFEPNPPPNVVTILYAEEQSGFLAGYAVVKEGFRDLGFMGGVAVPAVVRFGHGFLEGAELAAQELGLAAGEVTVNYHYIGGFAPDPGVVTMAGSWYAAGTEVIFMAAGRAWESALTAAEDGEDRWIVGVDVDQSAVSPRIMTSAMKALAVSVNDMLTDFANGAFRGGSDLHFDAAINGIGLPMENSHFSNFTQAQYDAIFSQLVNGAVVVSTTVTPTVAEAGLALEIITVNFIA